MCPSDSEFKADRDLSLGGYLQSASHVSYMGTSKQTHHMLLATNHNCVSRSSIAFFRERNVSLLLTLQAWTRCRSVQYPLTRRRQIWQHAWRGSNPSRQLVTGDSGQEAALRATCSHHRPSFGERKTEGRQRMLGTS